MSNINEFQLFADDEQSHATDISLHKEQSVVPDALTLLIVDDDEAVHIVTRYTLKEFSFNGAPIEIASAYSAAEAKQLLHTNPRIAVLLLDVVMDGRDAGLRLVEYIRNELKNRFVRIILRTGQPGEAPEFDVIHNFDINDYRSKTELNDVRLMTVVTVALRTFVDMTELEKLRQKLEVLVEERTQNLAETNKNLQKANELLNAVNNDLNDANEFKTQMLSIVAHDLKNPIAAIKGYVDIGLYEMNTIEDQVPSIRMILESIHNASTSMMKLVTDLLDTAAIELSTISLTPNTFYLSSLVNIVTDNFTEIAARKKQTINLEIRDNILISGDAQRLQQVFGNLLSNALKYSPHGATVNIRICEPFLVVEESSNAESLDLEPSEQNPTTEQPSVIRVRVEFQDEGPGISESDKAKMFQFFQRLSALPTGGETSHGVGLALVKKILALHNGTIWVESRKDQGISGSKFVVELPVVRY